jgi:hypothetical protein
MKETVIRISPLAKTHLLLKKEVLNTKVISLYRK